MEIIEKDVVILGAGVAGLATAVALKRVGVEALVLERSDGLRATGAALTLLPNAWRALRVLRVAHNLTSTYPPVKRGLITDVVSGKTQEVSYCDKTNRKENGPRPLHRKALLEALASELPVNVIRFSSKLVTMETQPCQGSSVTILRLEDETIIKAKIFIGCDGVHSMVARHLGLAKPVDSGRSAVRGLAVYPEGHGLPHEVHQFVDAGKRAGYVPVNQTEVYWFMTSNISFKGDERLSPQDIKNEVIENLAKSFPNEYLNVVKHADLSTISWAPLMFRYPWNLISTNLSEQNVTLAGDAMHPMTPDLGQGGGSALEDAIVLGRHIGKSFMKNERNIVLEDTSRALRDYVKERRWRVVGLIVGSYMSGVAQQCGSNWMMKWVRDFLFYRLIFPKFLNFADFDCGQILDCSSCVDDLDNSNKLD